MKNFITICVLMIFICLLSGGSCSTLGDLSNTNEFQENSFVEITSNPLGAIIEIDDIYMGKTPLKIPANNKTIVNACDLYLNHDNKFAMITIRATPKNEGYTQVKIIKCNQIFSGVKLYFDMRLQPINR
jgi:hypothetical protein